MRYEDLNERGRANFDELARKIANRKQRCMQEVGRAPHDDGTVGYSLCRATKVVWLRDVRVMVDLSHCIAVCDAHVDYVPFPEPEGDGRRVIRPVMWPLEEHLEQVPA